MEMETTIQNQPKTKTIADLAREMLAEQAKQDAAEQNDFNECRLQAAKDFEAQQSARIERLQAAGATAGENGRATKDHAESRSEDGCSGSSNEPATADVAAVVLA